MALQVTQQQGHGGGSTRRGPVDAPTPPPRDPRSPPSSRPPLPPLPLLLLQLNGLGATATAVPLPWGDTALAHLGAPLDWVLASDVLYCQAALPPFLATLRALCGPATRVLICAEHRAALPFPAYAFAGAGFCVEGVGSGEQHPEWSSPDIQLYRLALTPCGKGARSSSRSKSGGAQ